MKINLQLARLTVDAGNVCEPLNIALKMLFRAYQYANDTRVNPWQFAVEIEEFHRMGVTRSELRWLISKGLAVHAREFSDPNSDSRTFRQLPRHLFPAGTCFVLSKNMAAELANGNGVNGHAVRISKTASPKSLAISEALSVPTSLASEPALPQWNSQRRELSLDGLLVKKFRTAAANQEFLIVTFNEERWPVRIDDPLPPDPNLDCRCRLINTIKQLNRSQVNSLVRFSGDGSGKGILWARAK